ncbi:MAG: 5'/3'-nucleotidase SurE [Treponema sp.]|nr:5'/3'-nucleotidase SurE [Treponema sp.]
MTVLLTNDDGFGEPGIECLYETLRKEHEVYVLAPEHNMSGTSALITMFRPLTLHRKGENRFSLEGSPADCVITAVKSGIFPRMPDIVFSGINADSNLGTDIIYSGTCAAARQASLYGIPGVGLSVEKKGGRDCPERSFDFEGMADFALSNIDKFHSLCGNRLRESEYGEYEYFLNINGASVKKYEGARFTSLCTRVYNDAVTVREENGTLTAEIHGGGQIVSLGGKDSDFAVSGSSCVSVSILKTQPEYIIPDDKTAVAEWK